MLYPEKNQSGHKMLTTPLGIKVTVETVSRRRICVFFSLSLICLISASLLAQHYVRAPTTFRKYIKPDVVPYHQPNNKSLQFDHKPKHTFDHIFPLAEPLTCFNGSRQPRPVFLLVFIASSSGNYKRRQAIRETWGSPKEIMGKNIITVFLLGETESGTPKLLQKESATHHDILQADFLDTYKNLTIKTIVGMKWIHTYCPHVSYFMKTDDDMYISYANIIKNLSAPSTPYTDFAMGYLFKKNRASRSYYNKFYMPRCMFPEKFYPPYLAGSGYVMSADLARKIHRTSLSSSFVYFEDVFVGVCLRTLGVRPIGHSGFHFEHIGYEFCKYSNDVISSHGVETKEMHDIWNDLQHSEALCLKSIF